MPLLLALWLSVAPASEPAQVRPLPVVLDTDIGDDIDDSWALALALRSPELDLRLVLTDYGNTEHRAAIVGYFLEAAGRTDVPIGIGVKQREDLSPQAAQVEGYDLAKYPGVVHRDGVQALIDLAMAAQEPLTLIAIGPAPNLKAALEREPRIAGKLRLAGMYGSLRRGYGGKPQPQAEWNVRADAASARALLGAPWRDAISTPLDTCGLVQLKGERYARVRDSQDPLARAVIDGYRSWCANRDWCVKDADFVSAKSSTLFDTVAVYLAISRELVRTERLGVRVTDAGMTVIDEDGPPLEWATEWRDLEAFEEWLATRIAGASAAAPVAALVADGGTSGYPIAPVPFTAVRLSDSFWSSRLETNRTVTIPFGFRKSEDEGRLRNFERAAKRLAGPYEGKMPFDDTDVYKLIEGASYSLQSHPDPRLDRFLDEVIATVAAAQEPDGYLTTYKTIDPTKSPAWWLKPGPRWQLELAGSHELYNAGHLYEAAYAHFRATGKRTLLEIALRNADLVDRTFGPGRLTTPPGHQIIETGLFKLAAATGDARYAALARFFLDQRGDASGHTLFGAYNQDHLPVLEQREAVGHAVRALYMYAGMADVAAFQGDASYREAVERLFVDVVSRKLYLTGGLGARHEGEAFGDGFELPNRTAYAETCAAIASVYWTERLFRLTGEARYVDVLERTLYNGVIAGVSLQGDTFFYPNPLESDGRHAFNHGAATRQPWFDSSCCPTNLARFVPAVPDYVYAAGHSRRGSRVRGEALYVNLYVASEARAELAGGAVRITQKTDYPWDGRVELRVEPEQPREIELRLRIPGWARGEPVPSALYRFEDVPGPSSTGDSPSGTRAPRPYTLRVNGAPLEAPLDGGYAVVARRFSPGDVVTLELPMPVRRVVADERVAEDRGKVAFERGPLVYCAEGADNGGSVLDLAVPDDVRFEVEEREELLGGVRVLRGAVKNEKGEARPLTLIPYYAWSNRGAGEMVVWMKRAGGK